MIHSETAYLEHLTQQERFIVACAIVLGAYLLDFLCCKLVIPFLRKVSRKTPFKWDDYLTSGKVMNHVFHLIPPVAFLFALPFLLPEHSTLYSVVAKVLYCYAIFISSRLVCAFIDSVYFITNESEALKNKPIKGVYQMIKVLVYCMAVILIIGVILDKNLTTLVAGLGASAAVLMLIFKDTILGVVAGVQLSAYDMVRPGDWIVLEKYGIDGIVQEVALNTVKVRSWDNTIMTVPPYVLVSDSFKNWRGMSESGGRRVARSLRIDVNSIRFCTPEELSVFEDEPWVKEAKGPDGQVVNLSLFRAATEHYLANHPDVNNKLWVLVRQLEPTSEGLPLQLYFFTKNKLWVPHEHLAADIIEYIIASMPKFGLRLYQKPTNISIECSCGSQTRGGDNCSPA